MCLDPEPGGEVERAAPPELALHPDLSPHELDQPRGDRQTQTCPTVFSGGGAVRLGKGLEYPSLDLGWNADPRVRDGEVEPDGLRLLSGRLDMQHDLPAFGELDGVAEQIHQHLSEPSGVPGERVGNIGQEVAGQL